MRNIATVYRYDFDGAEPMQWRIPWDALCVCVEPSYVPDADGQRLCVEPLCELCHGFGRRPGARSLVELELEEARARLEALALAGTVSLDEYGARLRADRLAAAVEED